MVARGLASRLRLKPARDKARNSYPGSRQGIGFSPEIETVRGVEKPRRKNKSPGDWLLA